MSSTKHSVEILATGDLGPCRSNPSSIFDLVRTRLQSADIVLGQLEPVLTSRGSQAPQARLAMRSPPATAQAIRDAGFDIVSFASNHCMDWGTEGLQDTCSALRGAGLEVIGAGGNIVAARAAAIQVVNGTRIGFLAYNSILPMGYWADANRAGCVPLRAWTIQEQIEHDQPGTPSRAHSFPHREDLAAMIDDIGQLTKHTDVVVVSIHWGIHFVPAVIADYQRDLGRAAIDAGADVVVGHHPHVLKGVEIYKDKAIVYSLANFAIDPPTAFQPGLTALKSHQEVVALNPTWRGDDQKLVFPESCKSAVARILVRDKRVASVEVLPVYINDDSQPEFLRAADPRFTEIAEYLSSISASQQLNPRFAREGDALSIAAR